MRRLALLLSAAVLAPSLASAQRPAPDTLTLPVLQQQARANDPRIREIELLNRQSRLRLDNLGTERLPTFSLQGQAQYQSDVTGFSGPGAGAGFPQAPHDTYDARLGVEQSLYDPTLSPRRAVERAELGESQARLETALYTLRQEVNEAWFAAGLLDARSRLVQAIITDLEARLREAAARVEAGTALPGDSAAIAATVLLRRQDNLELGAQRRAALNRLELLSGVELADSVVLVLPGRDLPEDASMVLREGRVPPALQARPEYRQFTRSRERLALQERLAGARLAPRLSAYGRAGYGQPGLNALNDGFDSYWLAGIQAQWSPFNWGRTARERRTLELQREILNAEEAAFTAQLTRAIQDDLAGIRRLDSTLALDRRIIALRELVEREARLRFQEGVLTSAEYLDRLSDVLESRLAFATHEVEQARLRARLLTTLGLETP